MAYEPYKAFRFEVVIDGIISAGFTDVSGLSLTTETESIREGGVNSHVYKLPKYTTQTDLVLKKGQTDVEDLWLWYADVREGNIIRKSGSIYLIDDAGYLAIGWDFYDAYPISWTGPIFSASANTVAFESVTLAHNGLVKAF